MNLLAINPKTHKFEDATLCLTCQKWVVLDFVKQITEDEKLGDGYYKCPSCGGTANPHEENCSGC